MHTLLLCLLPLLGCAAALPANNAARPIHVTVAVKGERAEQAQFRIERQLVRDPDVGIGQGDAYVDVELNLGLSQIAVCSSNWGRGQLSEPGICYGLRVAFLPSVDEDEQLDALVRWATAELLDRLHGRWPAR